MPAVNKAIVTHIRALTQRFFVRGSQMMGFK